MKNTIDKTWEIHVYRKQQSLVTMLKKISQNIFLEICIGGHQANNLWPAVKP